MYEEDKSVETQEVADPVDLDNETVEYDNLNDFFNQEEPDDYVDDSDDSDDLDDSSDEENEGDISENNQEVADPEADLYAEPERDLELDSKFAAARRDSENKLKALEKRQNEFAKTHGYGSFDEMEDYLNKQQYIDNGVTEELAEKLVKNDKMYAQMQEQINKARVAEEKSKFRGQRFFSELESDIDSLIEHNPNLTVEVAFNYMKGMKIDELTQNAKKVAAQKALNNAKSKSHMKADGKGVNIDTTHIDEGEWSFYKALNPKANRNDYMKFLKNEKRR